MSDNLIGGLSPPIFPPNTRKYEFLMSVYISQNDLEHWLHSRFEMNVFQHYCYILHDKDTFKDDDQSVLNGRVSAGDLKKAHFHILIRCYNAKTLSALERDFKSCKWIQSDGNPAHIEYLSFLLSRAGSFDYLTHSNDTTKFQYSESDIVSSPDGVSFFSAPSDLIGDGSDITLSIFDDFVKKTSIRDMIQKYGREFLYHINCYKTARSLDNDLDEYASLKSDLDKFQSQLDYLKQRNNRLQEYIDYKLGGNPFES